MNFWAIRNVWSRHQAISNGKSTCRTLSCSSGHTLRLTFQQSATLLEQRQIRSLQGCCERIVCIISGGARTNRGEAVSIMNDKGRYHSRRACFLDCLVLNHRNNEISTHLRTVGMFAVALLL